MTGLTATTVLAAAALLTSACASPEARRTRGGGPGGDIGNRGPIVALHAGADPYYRTPCVTQVECAEPKPASIRNWARD